LCESNELLVAKRRAMIAKWSAVGEAEAGSAGEQPAKE
jgi:hypothetical protein